MSGDWFHQHFGIGKEGLRVSAWHGPNNQRSRKAGRPGEQMIDAGAIDIKKGGAAIPYYMEDPNIRVEFGETLKKEGLANRMNPEFYDPDSKAADEMGDVM
jgi:hypothetical protein